jgi:hypothetical protein
MESAGVSNKIHLSQQTADLLTQANKGHWLIKRENKVKASGKGKILYEESLLVGIDRCCFLSLINFLLLIGEIQTYFLDVKSAERGSVVGSPTPSISKVSMAGEILSIQQSRTTERRNRVVEWTVEIMAQQLLVMIQVRKDTHLKPDPIQIITELEERSKSQYESLNMVVDEVAEAIILPDYNSKMTRCTIHDSNDDKNNHLDPVVLYELRSYVQTIASLYKDNPCT